MAESVATRLERLRILEDVKAGLAEVLADVEAVLDDLDVVGPRDDDEHEQVCRRCNGSGDDPLDDTAPDCLRCNGSGEEPLELATPLSEMSRDPGHTGTGRWGGRPRCPSCPCDYCRAYFDEPDPVDYAASTAGQASTHSGQRCYVCQGVPAEAAFVHMLGLCYRHVDGLQQRLLDLECERDQRRQQVHDLESTLAGMSDPIKARLDAERRADELRREVQALRRALGELADGLNGGYVTALRALGKASDGG